MEEQRKTSMKGLTTMPVWTAFSTRVSVFDFHLRERENIAAEEIIAVASEITVVDLVAQVVAHLQDASHE